MRTGDVDADRHPRDEDRDDITGQDRTDLDDAPASR
jgi:hypothetical protein